MGDESRRALLEEMLAFTIPPEMIRDLLVFARLDARTSARISEVLSTLVGFQSQASATHAVQGCLPDSSAESAVSIVRTLLNVKPNKIARFVSIVDQWRKTAEDEQGAEFTDEVVANLDRNLRAIIASYPCLGVIRKAAQLLRAVGNEFESIRYVCDLRPVFDNLRKQVDGFLMLANMRLMYVSQDGEHHAFEVALTEDELNRLIKTSEEARAKLEVLKVTAPVTQQINDGQE